MSGYLDEGINSRDDRLLSSSRQKPKPRGGSIMDKSTARARSNTSIQNQRSIDRSSYEPVPKSTSIAQRHDRTQQQHIQQNTNAHPVQYEPLVTSKSLCEQSKETNKLDDSENLREFIIEKTASYESNQNHFYFSSNQQLHYPANGTQVESQNRPLLSGPSERIKSSIPSPNHDIHRASVARFDIEHEEDDEDFTCCDFHSTPRQPLCNEGTKNLCTLTIWAIIIFVIVNRFLMHMSMFLHRGATVEMKSNTPNDVIDNSLG